MTRPLLDEYLSGDARWPLVLARTWPLRRKWPTTSALTLIVLSILLGACGNSSQDSGIDVQDSQLVAEGSQLYAANCASCHGSDLRGTEIGPSHLSQVYEPGHHGDGAFLVAVLRGSQAHHWNFGPMPRIEGLSTSDVDAIVAFVRERQRIEGFEPYPP